MVAELNARKTKRTEAKIDFMMITEWIIQGVNCYGLTVLEELLYT